MKNKTKTNRVYRHALLSQLSNLSHAQNFRECRAPFFFSVNHLRRLWQVLTIQVSFVNTMFCLLLYQLAYFAGISLTSFLRAVLGATDHKGVMRGRCTLCPCVGYKEAKSTNKCAGCFCHIAPTAKHDGLPNWFSFSFSKFWFWFWFLFLFLFCFLLFCFSFNEN